MCMYIYTYKLTASVRLNNRNRKLNKALLLENIQKIFGVAKTLRLRHTTMPSTKFYLHTYT